MGTINFHLRTDKKNDKKGSPINLNYSIHGQRKSYLTKVKLFEVNWNQKDQKAVYLDKKAAKRLAPDIEYELLITGKMADNVNATLNSLRNSILDIEKRFELDKVAYSSEMVIDRLKQSKSQLTKKEIKSSVILEYIDKYITDHAATRVKGSMTVYKSLKSHLSAMVADKKIRLTFENIDHRFMQDFQNFLIEHRNLSNTTVAKQLSTLKTFLGYARKEGFTVSDKYRDFKIKEEKLEVIALTQDEFQALLDLDLSNNKRLDQLRDVFAFSCATGLRYSDLAQLRREHIYSDEIRITVKKTKEILTIPLNQYSYAILKKYKGMYKPLPVISNQKMNEYLKGWDDVDDKGRVIKHHPGLCEIAGIDTPTEIVRFKGATREVKVYPKFELIGVHTARKTFVTLSLSRGMSAEQVMKCSGHSDYKSFQRYVDITNERKKVAMVAAWGDIPKSKLKAV